MSLHHNITEPIPFADCMDKVKHNALIAQYFNFPLYASDLGRFSQGSMIIDHVSLKESFQQIGAGPASLLHDPFGSDMVGFNPKKEKSIG